MIWSSPTFMTIFDVGIIALMLAMCGFMLSRNRRNPIALGRKARFLPLAGLGLVAVFYTAIFLQCSYYRTSSDPVAR